MKKSTQNKLAQLSSKFTLMVLIGSVLLSTSSCASNNPHPIDVNTQMSKNALNLTKFDYLPRDRQEEVQLLHNYSKTTPYQTPCPNLICFINRLPLYLRNDASRLLQQYQEKDSIIDALERPGVSRPWYVFAKNNASNAKVKQAVEFYFDNKQSIDAISQQFGVDKEVILGILAIETNVGRNMGNFRTLDALSTIAFNYPRRQAYFQNELKEFIVMTHLQKSLPTNYMSSYAGAMGMPQFMPSSYNKFAIDYRNDGLADIWNDPEDIVASVANYLKNHGFQYHRAMYQQVFLSNQALANPQIQSILNGKTNMNHTVGKLTQLGVQINGQIPPNTHVILYQLEVSPNTFNYYIGFQNFYTVWHYNHSQKYVHAVALLAQKIGQQINRP